MPDQTTKLRRKVARLEQMNACQQAVIVALYEVIDRMQLAAVAAGVDIGVAEGARGDLDLDQEIQALLDDNNWS